MDGDWELKARTDGRVMKKIPAQVKFGIKLLMQLGVVQIQEHNTIQQLMNGILALKVEELMHPTHVVNTCF
jgi:hypothetical protein